MNITDAILLTNKIFVYESDNSYYLFPETWRVVGNDGRGDCEDYSLTVIWYYSEGSWIRWLWNVNFGPFRFWYCRSPGDNGHMITEIKSGEHKGLFLDNIFKRLLTREEIDKMGYKLKLRYFWPLPMLRIIIGYTIGTLGRLIRKLLD